MDSRISGLVECEDPDPEPCVFPDQFQGLFVGVEGVHQDQRHVGIVTFVQPFNLDTKVGHFS